MNKWTILSAVVCLGALVTSVVEARPMRSSGGCANGQCSSVAAAPATAVVPSATQAIPTAATADATKTDEKSEAKVETTDKAADAPAAAAAPQRRASRFASGRFLRLRRSWR